MSVEFKVDDREFQETLRKYLAVSSRTLPQALNEKMFFIVRGAVRGLPSVEKSKIEEDMGLSGHELQYTKEREKAVRKKSIKREAKKAIKQAFKQAKRGLKKDIRAATKSGRR